MSQLDEARIPGGSRRQRREQRSVDDQELRDAAGTFTVARYATLVDRRRVTDALAPGESVRLVIPVTTRPRGTSRPSMDPLPCALYI